MKPRYLHRRGGILLESAVAMLLLSLVIASSAQLISMLRRQSRLLEQRTIALQECHIGLTTAASLPSGEVNAEKLAAIGLPAEALNALPEGALKITIEPRGAEEEGTRLKAQVRWRPAPTADLAKVELSVWRFDVPPAAEGGGR